MSESPSQVTGEPERPRRAEVLSEAKKNEPGRPRRAEVLSEAKKNEPGRPRRAEVLSEAKKNEPGRPRRAEVLSEAKDKISSSQRDEAQRAQDQISPDLIRSDLTLTPSGKSDTACSNHILSFGEDQTEEDEGQKSEEQKEYQQEDTSSSSDNGIVPCHICAYEVTNEQYAVECDSCCEWYHALCLEQNHNLPYNKVLPCENVYVAHSDKLFQLLDSKQVFNEGFPFVCKTCNVDNLPLPVSLYNKHFFNTKQMIQINSWPSEFDLNEYLTVYNQRVENEIKDGERSVMEGKVEGVPGSTQKEPVGGQGGSTQKEPVTIGSSHVYIPQNCDASPSSNLFHDHLRGLSDDGIQAELLRTTPFEWREENVLARERLAKVESMKSRRENAGIKNPVPLNRGEETGRIDVTEGRSPLNPQVVEFPSGDALPNEASSAGYSKGLKVDRKGVEAPQVQAKPPPEKSNQRVTIQQATGTESTQVNQNTQSVSNDSSASLIQILLQQINEQQKAQVERESRMRKEEREAQVEREKRECEVQLEREQRMYEQMRLFMQNNNNHNNTVPIKKKSLVKLPTLELPEFHGDWMKWPEFWQLWNDVYHTEEELTPVQKFRYLLKYVKSDAYQVIEQIPIVGENYQIVIDMLRDKYDNPDKIAHMHLKAIQALPSVTRINAIELRTFYENIEKHLRNLQQGDEHFEIRYSLLIRPLMAKLPVIVQDKMLTQHGSQIKKSINKFRESLHQIIKTQELLEFEEKPMPQETSVFQSAEVRGKENREIQELQRQMQQLQQTQQMQETHQQVQLVNPKVNPRYARKVKECRFCKTPHPQLHPTTWCPNYTSIAERKRILEERKICTNCLGSHTDKCSAARTVCFICNGRHISALCPNEDFSKPSSGRYRQPYRNQQQRKKTTPGAQQRPSTATVSVQLVNRESEINPNDQDICPVQPELGECDPHANCSVYEYPKDRGETMMQIAVATIRSSTPPNTSKQVTTLIDTGASDTYLTVGAAREIGAELWGAERCPIASFANDKPKWIQKYRVNFDLSLRIPPTDDLRNDSLNLKRIDGLAVRQICQVIDVPGIQLSKTEVKLLRGMSHQLADPSFNKNRRLKIDMLLANDYYPQLLLNESFRLENSQVYLIKTALGWVSAGRITEAAMNTQRNAPVMVNISLSQNRQTAIPTLSGEQTINTVCETEQSGTSTSKECSLEHLKTISDVPVMHKTKVVTLPSPIMPTLITGMKPQTIQTQSIKTKAQIPKLIHCVMQVATETILQQPRIQVVQSLNAMKSHSCVPKRTPRANKFQISKIGIQSFAPTSMQKITKTVGTTSQHESIVDTEWKSSLTRSPNVKSSTSSSDASLEKASLSCIPKRSHSSSSLVTIGHIDSQNCKPLSAKEESSSLSKPAKNHKIRKKSPSYASSRSPCRFFSLLSSERTERKRKERSNKGCKFKFPDPDYAGTANRLLGQTPTVHLVDGLEDQTLKQVQGKAKVKLKQIPNLETYSSVSTPTDQQSYFNLLVPASSMTEPGLMWTDVLSP